VPISACTRGLARRLWYQSGLVGALAPRGEVEAFREWGTGAVGRLRGEFAFALTDTAVGRVYLAGTRSG
jgi:hypothetical protein